MGIWSNLLSMQTENRGHHYGESLELRDPRDGWALEQKGLSVWFLPGKALFYDDQPKDERWP